IRPHPHSTLFPYTTLFRSSMEALYVTAPEKIVGSLRALAGIQYDRGPRTGGLLTQSRAFGGRPRQPCRLVGAAGRYTFEDDYPRSEEHTSELQSRFDLVCR